jgi:predicted transposase YbfD/YdcC
VKSNEITAIPKLLEMLDLRGATVTVDAMGCQRDIAKQIAARGADYVFGLKGNQPTLHREVLDAFDASTCAALARDPRSYSETADKGHGRLEVRRVWVQRDVSWLTKSEAWPGLASLILVESERTRRGVTSCERRAYISSSSASAAELGAQVRGHWHIENKLHWVLDVTFGEDHARMSRKNGAENMATMRKIAINMLTRAPSSHEKPMSKPMKQMVATMRFSYLLTVLTGAAPPPAAPERRRNTRAW